MEKFKNAKNVNYRLFCSGNLECQRKNYSLAIKHYYNAILKEPKITELVMPNLCYAKDKYLKLRKFKKKRVIIGCWDICRNPAGRAVNLAQIYKNVSDVTILGVLDVNKSKELWKPIANCTLKISPFFINDWSNFVESAIEYVLSNPCDVFHMSKPRAPNIIFGMLYKIIWYTKIIVDIDDEELEFFNGIKPIKLDNNTVLPPIGLLCNREWTRIGVGLIDIFDAVTVSNVCLQQKYGGVLIPHVRNKNKLNNKYDVNDIRKNLGINKEDKVIIFMGTPRVHKGLVDVARLIKKLNMRNLVFLIVGSFENVALKNQIQAISGVRVKYVDDVPFEDVPKYLSVADVSILLQDENSGISKYQMPAKLTDLLSMGVVTFATNIGPISELIKNNIVLQHDSTTPKKLVELFTSPTKFASYRSRGLDYFNTNLTVDGSVQKIVDLMSGCNPRSSNLLKEQKFFEIYGLSCIKSTFNFVDNV